MEIYQGDWRQKREREREEKTSSAKRKQSRDLRNIVSIKSADSRILVREDKNK